MAKYFLGIIFLLLLLHVSMAQQALKVGDQCPDIRFSYYTKGVTTEKGLYDFRGQWIILDFWATYCGGCIKGLEKLEELGDNFEGKLHVLPVSTQSLDRVAPFWNKNTITSNLRIGTAIGGEDFDLLFPRTSVPHYVVIDTVGRVVAITYQEFITPENIANLLSGNNVRFADKTVQNKAAREEIVSEGENIPHIMGKSVLTRYDPSVAASTGKLQFDTVGGIVTLRIANNTIYDLYLKSVDPLFAQSRKLRVIDGVDSAKLFYRKEAGGYQVDWNVMNRYTYELSFSQGLNVEIAKAKMKDDLNFYFQLDGRIEAVEKPVWQIGEVTIRNKERLRSSKKALTLGSLMAILNNKTTLPYVVNTSTCETTALICTLDDMPSDDSAHHLRTWLEGIGVKVDEEIQQVECFVISER